eukprot:6172226-Amphidinium_carterae.1
MLHPQVLGELNWQGFWLAWPTKAKKGIANDFSQNRTPLLQVELHALCGYQKASPKERWQSQFLCHFAFIA